jgi:hypothetical protein
MMHFGDASQTGEEEIANRMVCRLVRSEDAIDMVN